MSFPLRDRPQPQLQLRVFLLFSPVIYCSPPPLAVQPSIFTTFLPGEQQQQHLALPAARRQVPQVDLGRESGGSLSAASSSMDLLLPCAVAAVSAIDSCASGWLCLQPVDMHGTSMKRQDAAMEDSGRVLTSRDCCSGRCAMRTEPWVV
ncbi:hypothetical protein KUCAC02_003428 [Chaenocephalus aceratus]|uniref:Uncharacterized protein n=1 Tax=Chaenocephalus aceratus TaxID=36190 RepID=A0ACB9WLP0_CHAAC|nr:hypothetical protein KUCAC02_003428 [Chaenocephalus aceratus]